MVLKNLNKKYKLNEVFVRKIISKILGLLKKPQGTELEVVFLTDAAIKELNKKYKNRKRPTDVLSFNIDRGAPEGGSFIGVIFISLDTALKNSKIFRTRFTDEIVLYLIHGILHIFGHKDAGTKDRLKMSRREGGILKYLCESEDLSKVLTRR